MLHRQVLLLLLRRRRLVVVPRWLNVGPAERARRLRSQPHVDALHMVKVLAQGQPPNHLAGLHRADAHRALLPVSAATADVMPGGLRIRELGQLGDVDAGAASLWITVACHGGGDRRSAADAVLAE